MGWSIYIIESRIITEAALKEEKGKQKHENWKALFSPTSKNRKLPFVSLKRQNTSKVAIWLRICLHYQNKERHENHPEESKIMSGGNDSKIVQTSVNLAKDIGRNPEVPHFSFMSKII